MKNIQIKEVKTAQQRKEFIYLPEKINAHNPLWLPPLYLDEEKFFNPKKNPAFAHNPTVLFLAYDNGKAVGRIMGIIPTEYNLKQKENSARFAYFDCYENPAYFRALLGAITQWAKQQHCQKLVGPMGFSDKEPQGFVTEGFDAPSMMITSQSPEFMQKMIRQEGFSPMVELYQYEIPLKDAHLQRYHHFAQRIQERFGLTVHEFTQTRQVKPFVQPVFRLINQTYQQIYGFNRVSEEEMKEFAQRFLPLLNPKLIKIISNKQGEVIAFIIAMADMSLGIRKAKGRLLPWGWYHIYQSAKRSKRLVLLLGAISPAYQGKGLDAILASRLLGSAQKLGFILMDSHLIMKENHKMRNEIERIPQHKCYKKYAIFSKNI